MLVESQKIALITGSAVRVGKYIAENLSSRGWKIAIHFNHSKKEAIELARKLIEFNDVTVHKADLTNFSQITKMISEIHEQLGNIDLLINNASVYKNDLLENLNEENFDENINLHLKAPMFLAKLLAKQDTMANIINILDDDIKFNRKNFFSYSVSKKALAELTRMLALSLAPNIRVNAIAPGPILFKEGQDLGLFNRIIASSPLKTKTDLEDLLETIEFLVKTESITGQCIFLDGGRHLNS